MPQPMHTYLAVNSSNVSSCSLNLFSLELNARQAVFGQPRAIGEDVPFTGRMRKDLFCPTGDVPLESLQT